RQVAGPDLARIRSGAEVHADLDVLLLAEVAAGGGLVVGLRAAVAEHVVFADPDPGLFDRDRDPGRRRRREDAPPVRVAARDRRLDQRARRDAAADVVGVRLARRAGDADRD